MANSWSFLFDELSMTNQDYWEDDGFSIVGNPGTASSDTININGTHLPGGMGDDHITFSADTGFMTFGAAQSVPMDYFSTAGKDRISFYDDFELPLPKQENNIMNKDSNRYKYSEDVILKELKDYIAGTYNQHYSAGDDKIQTLDLIEACGDGESFCRSNILKYASRYDKKGTARRDIMKILHYAVLLMHFNDKNAQSEPYPQ